MINQDCIKLLKVIRSCRTSQHFTVAYKMVENFEKKYAGDNDLWECSRELHNEIKKGL